MQNFILGSVCIGAALDLGREFPMYHPGDTTKSKKVGRVGVMLEGQFANLENKPCFGELVIVKPVIL